MCGGELESLGTLGAREHFRCRACGVGYSVGHVEPEPSQRMRKIREAIERERAHAAKRSSR